MQLLTLLPCKAFALPNETVSPSHKNRRRVLQRAS